MVWRSEGSAGYLELGRCRERVQGSLDELVAL